ncbi:RNA polymerase sigma factor, partial [Leptospira ellisii]|uniref:RNA polymerase sigma factor n=1 Tax=Leptospira ellisii TaxID=2023197 RepID=UPI001FAF8746
MNLSKDKTLDLVSRCGDGDEEALKQFFELYSEDIYNFPMKIFHLSEDDAGDFFIYAFERLKTGSRFGSFKGKSSFRTWFYSVLRNMLIDWQRTKRELKVTNLGKISKEGKEYATIEDEPDTRPGMQKEAGELSERFNQALEEIGVDKRVIFKLSYIYYLNLNEDEIQYLIEKDLQSYFFHCLLEEDRFIYAYKNRSHLLIHTEYPTPFKCIMDKNTGNVYPDFGPERRMRGHIDII